MSNTFYHVSDEQSDFKKEGAIPDDCLQNLPTCTGLQLFKMNVHHPRRNVVTYDTEKDHSSFYLILHILHSRSVLFCL